MPVLAVKLGRKSLSISASMAPLHLIHLLKPASPLSPNLTAFHPYPTPSSPFSIPIPPYWFRPHARPSRPSLDLDSILMTLSIENVIRNVIKFVMRPQGLPRDTQDPPRGPQATPGASQRLSEAPQRLPEAPQRPTQRHPRVQT